MLMCSCGGSSSKGNETPALSIEGVGEHTSLTNEDFLSENDGSTNPLVNYDIDSGRYLHLQSGVEIVWSFDSSIFPPQWLLEPVNGSGVALDESEIDRSLSVIVQGLNKYPTELLAENLDTVYLLNRLMFYGVTFSGTNSSENVYISNQGVSNGFTDHWIEKVFHQELSSILLRNRPNYFDESAWVQENPIDFDYVGSGVTAIKTGDASTNFNSTCIDDGFLTQYASSSLENDFNAFAGNLFVGTNEFWGYVDSFDKIRHKTTVAINFYYNLDSMFMETYFRGWDVLNTHEYPSTKRVHPVLTQKTLVLDKAILDVIYSTDSDGDIFPVP